MGDEGKAVGFRRYPFIGKEDLLFVSGIGLAKWEKLHEGRRNGGAQKLRSAETEERRNGGAQKLRSAETEERRN